MPERSDLADMIAKAFPAKEWNNDGDGCQDYEIGVLYGQQRIVDGVMAVLRDLANRDTVLAEMGGKKVGKGAGHFDAVIDDGNLRIKSYVQTHDDWRFPVTDNETLTPHVSRETNEGVT